MLCNKDCPRGTACEPISNIVSKNSFVCIGYHHEEKGGRILGDIFRHCFKNSLTDTMFDYDEYDIKSVLSVMSEALLIDELKK